MVEAEAGAVGHIPQLCFPRSLGAKYTFLATPRDLRLFLSTLQQMAAECLEEGAALHLKEGRHHLGWELAEVRGLG